MNNETDFAFYLSIVNVLLHGGNNLSTKFDYFCCNDGTVQLFFKKSEDETFCEWDLNLQPEDPHYKSNPDSSIILKDKFPLLDVCDEQVFHHMIFAINSITTVPKLTKYNYINAFMKLYCFFQLSNSRRDESNSAQRISNNNFLFRLFMFTHPVNEETLNAFTLDNSGEIVHIPSGITLRDYASAYYDYFIEHYDQLSSQIVIEASEIEAAKILHLSLVDMIEKGSFDLKIPAPALPVDMKLINDAVYFTKVYSDDRERIVRTITTFLQGKNTHEETCLNFLLQNFVVYILRMDFKEIYNLLNSFSQAEQKQLLINQLFKRATFIKWIMDEKSISFDRIKEITCFFDDEAKKMYRI
ncbi:hypothetical protein ACOII5_004179 [Cronobacter dublinensis]